jgi:hypothetical protein
LPNVISPQLPHVYLFTCPIQVAEFGCEAFALLFDDILPEMSDSDKEVFQSFAHAQVSVTNEIFEHLGRTRFLFCPTQYSASRAVPDVPTSEYLQTIGNKLDKDIDIMWTGKEWVKSRDWFSLRTEVEISFSWSNHRLEISTWHGSTVLLREYQLLVCN